MRVIHIVKMIYNVSHHYNTPERVASLLVKITNQVIRTCKRYITQGGRKTIWNQDRQEVEEKLMQCIKLNQDYKDAYARVINSHFLVEFTFLLKFTFFGTIHILKFLFFAKFTFSKSHSLEKFKLFFFSLEKRSSKRRSSMSDGAESLSRSGSDSSVAANQRNSTGAGAKKQENG